MNNYHYQVNGDGKLCISTACDLKQCVCSFGVIFLGCNERLSRIFTCCFPLICFQKSFQLLYDIPVVIWYSSFLLLQKCWLPLFVVINCLRALSHFHNKLLYFGCIQYFQHSSQIKTTLLCFKRLTKRYINFWWFTAMLKYVRDIQE